MAGKENQRIKLTKRLLKDSLISLLAQKDIYQISIRELCEDAGLNRSTFYKYYGSQYDLLKDMENDMLCHITGTLENRSDTISPQTVIHIFTYLESNLQLSRLLINNNVDPDFPKKLFGLEPIQEGLFSVLKVQFGEAEMPYVTTYVTYGCYHLIRKWINKDEREPAETMALLLLELVGTLIRQMGTTE